MSLRNFIIAALSLLLFYLSYVFKTSMSVNRQVKTAPKKVEMTTIKLKQSIVDIGNVSIKSVMTKVNFTIYNTGPHNLIIYDVEPDCKCTVGRVDKSKVIPVNDSSEIVLDYKPSHPGLFQVSALVNVNVESSPLLIVRGNVLP